MRYRLSWLPQREAFAFVNAHHRHHRAPRGDIFRIGAYVDQDLVGVIIVGRPVARKLQMQGRHVMEVLRLCVLDDQRNLCSLLYSRAWRSAKAMGCTWLLTYTLESEGGGSLRSAGWTREILSPGKSWSVPSRWRAEATYPLGPKVRWSKRG